MSKLLDGKSKYGKKAEAEGKQFDAEAVRKANEPLRSIELGEGLELWYGPLAMLKEQNLNARVMSSNAFLQLADVIGRDNRLESLPLCALTENGVEIISGHHRTRAARKAGMNEVWFMVDVTGLPRDKIRAKQLAHNSLQGEDDPELVAQIFAMILDADAKIEAFINDSALNTDREAVKLTTRDLDVEFDTKTATIVFLPTQFESFKTALSFLAALESEENNEVFLATLDEHGTFLSALSGATKGLNITSVPTLLAKMAEIVTAHLSAVEETAGAGE